MDFEKLVNCLESLIVPELEARARSLRGGPHFDEVRVTSQHQADRLHAIVIACHPKWSTDPCEHLTFTITICDEKWLSARADVSWDQIFRTGTSAGYVKPEGRGRMRKIATERDVCSFMEDWRILAARFDQAAAKGHPSARLLRFLRGAPRDIEAALRGGK